MTTLVVTNHPDPSIFDRSKPMRVCFDADHGWILEACRWGGEYEFVDAPTEPENKRRVLRKAWDLSRQHGVALEVFRRNGRKECKRRSSEFMAHVYACMDSGFRFIDAVRHVEKNYPDIRARDESKAAEKSRIASMVAHWNQTVPIGTPVEYETIKGHGWHESRTRSEAWVGDSGSPMVKIEGKAGGWNLEFVRVKR